METKSDIAFEQKEAEEEIEEVDEEIHVHSTLLDILKTSRLPVISWVVVITTFVACFYSSNAFLYYSVGGFAWLAAFAFSLIIITAKLPRISFPLYVWLPWILWVVGYSYMSDYTNLQRSAMLLCPIAVGLAASTARLTNAQLEVFMVLLKMFSVTLVFAVVVITGMLLTGVLPESTGLAPQAITTLLLSSIFISSYSFGYLRDIFWYIGIATVPIIALTRGPMAISGLLLPFSFSPIKLQTRVIMIILVAVVGLALFFSPRVQKKMFYTGEGELEDITSEKKLATSGRRHIAELMTIEIAQKPVWGHGANASETFILEHSGGQLTHPHNDWLRFLYDYGIVGTVLFALTILLQVRHILVTAYNVEEQSKIFMYGIASSFLAFILIMFTDNVVLYAAYFGNLQFCILGLCYGAYKQQRIDAIYNDEEENEEEEEQRSRTTRSRRFRHDSEG